MGTGVSAPDRKDRPPEARISDSRPMPKRPVQRVPEGLATRLPKIGKSVGWNARRMPPKPPITHKDEHEWAKLYLAGWTVDRVADDYGVSYSTVRRALHELGVPMRPRGNTGQGASPIVRIAELERQMGELTAQVRSMDTALAFLADWLYSDVTPDAPPVSFPPRRV